MTPHQTSTAEDFTIVEVTLPLPLSVAGTITKLIGTAYPESRIGGDTYGPNLTFLLPRGAKPKRVAKEVAPVISENDPDVTEFDGANLRVATPVQELTNIYLQAARESLADNPEAINYVEHLIIDRENNRRYALIFAHSPEQTPHQLRIEAEEKLATANRRIEELEGQLGLTSTAERFDG